MQYLNLYLNDYPGWRAYLVLKVGRIHARVICTETAEAFRVPKAELAHGRVLVLKPTRLAKRLRAVARAYGAEDSRGVKDGLAILRAR